MQKSKQSLSTLKKIVQKKLVELLEIKGFKSKKDRIIEYEEDDFKQIIHLAFVDNTQENFTSLIINLAIRSNQIEEMAMNFSWANNLTTKEKKEIATLGVQIGKLLNKGQLRWDIHSETECEIVAKKVFNLLEKTGIPYLVKHSDISAILKRFESDSFKEWHSLLGSRAIKLPIIYILLNRIDDAKIEFIQQYKLLIDSDDFLVSSYPQFVSEVCERVNITNPMKKDII